ncbi:MAG TPA: TolC family protein [Anaeromyxobacteraceae bacterium]|nr:TolC family protein [Anaeromyxobacteraceae bacterium]
MTTTALLLLAALAAGPAAAPLERVTFEEAVQRALAHAPGAVIAAEEIARVDGLLGQARSASLPALSATGTWTAIDHARSIPGRVTQPEEQWQGAATLAVPLVAPSRWASWVTARKALDATRIAADDVRRQVALAAGRAYLGVIAGRRAVEVTRSAVDLARARLDFAKARLRGGVGNALDEARAEQVLASGEAQLEAAQTGLARAREALGLATGAAGPLDAAEEPSLEAPPPAEAPEDRRPDVAAARARFDAAAAAARYSWADWIPSLLATAQGTLTDPAIRPTPPSGWQVQLVLSLPILEGGLRLGQLREREAIAREATAALDATLRQARSEVRVSVEAVQHQEASFSAARRAAEQAKTVLTLTSRAYEAGATNSLDLTTAQQQSRDADLAMVISEDAVRNARLDLLAAVGLFP